MNRELCIVDRQKAHLRIKQSEVIRKILRNLDLWERPQRSSPPKLFPHKPKTDDTILYHCAMRLGSMLCREGAKGSRKWQPN